MAWFILGVNKMSISNREIIISIYALHAEEFACENTKFTFKQIKSAVKKELGDHDCLEEECEKAIDYADLTFNGKVYF